MNVCKCKVQNGLILQETLYLLAVYFAIGEKKFGQSNMFNFCEYICTKEFWILGKNESSMAPMLHTNMLRRSEMEMFFLNNRIKMEGEQ